jgi:flavin reductase (DIM6/NTAB) family NADH-FMN oxidoreductase RutF
VQIDPAGLSRRDAYHFMISAIVPRAIAFVTTVSLQGRTNAAPFSYFTGVGSSPPSVLICAGRRREALKDTHRNIVETGEFVVNVVVEEIMDGVVIGGTDHPPDVSEIEMAGLATAPAVKVAPPLIAASPISLECRRTHIFEAAGSAIIVGEIVWVHVRDDVLAAGAAPGAPVVDPDRLRPISRLGGDLYARLGEVFERARPK